MSSEEQDKQSQTLKASEEKFRTMAESTSILVAVSDQSSNATYFNKAWADLTGRPMEDLLKFGWVDLIHPDDRDGFVNTYLTAFEARAPFTGEFRVLNARGEYRWLLTTGPPVFAPDGTFHGYISSSVDITDQKLAFTAVEQSEEDLRNMVMEAPIGICVMDGPTRVSQIVNDSFLEVAGKPREAIIGKNYWEPFAEAAPYYEQALTDVVEKGITFYANEVELMLIRRGREEMIFVTFVYAPLKKKDGRVKKVAVWVLENTPQVVARKRVEDLINERTKELAAANHDLQKSNRDLAQFAYIASHDLQEPLRKISTFSDMLGKHLGDKLDEQSKSFLNKINNSASRMNMLIRDVLTYSELDRVNEGFVQVDLDKIFEAVRTDYELVAMQVNASIDKTELPTIEAVPLQMSQLFANLLSNSLKFVRKGVAPVIQITHENIAPEQLKAYPNLDPALPYIRITIRDNGIGFKPELSEQIFNIFQRLHRKSEYVGTGIGLAICKKVVLNHGGMIDANGNLEEGASFNVILPVKRH